MSFGITKNTKTYNWPYLYYFDIEIFLALDASKTLIENQEQKLNELSKTLTEKIEREIDSNIYNPNLILDERLNSALFLHQRYSSFIGIFSMFESNLKALCLELINQQKISKSIRQYYSRKNGHLRSYWDFLDANYSFRNNSLIESFEYINNHKMIRNIIVHNNGIAKNNEVQKIKNLDISISKESNQIIINNHLFLFNVINEIEKFFNLLLLEIDKA